MTPQCWRTAISTKSQRIAPQKNTGTAWIGIGFDKPAVIQGVSLALSVAKGLGYAATVEASDDGTAWRRVADMPKAAQLQRLVMIQQTMSFSPVSGRYFRVVLIPAAPLPASLRPRDPAPGLIAAKQSAAEPTRVYRLFALVFHAAATVNEFEKKARPSQHLRAISTRSTAQAGFAPGSAVDPAKIVVLTDKMRPDGTLVWNPPAGNWTVLRMGYSLTGSENHPATAEIDRSRSRQAQPRPCARLSRALSRYVCERYRSGSVRQTRSSSHGGRQRRDRHAELD